MGLHPVTILLTCVFLDTVGVGLIIPCLYQLFTSLGASPSAYGLLSSLYGVGQLLGSPVLGAMCDRVGTKPILMASFVGSCLAYGSMGMAWALWVVVIARVGVGLIKQTQTIGIAYVVGVTDTLGRTDALAKFSTAGMIGFIFGPVFGSLLSRVEPRLPFYVSASIFAVTSAIAAVFLPNVRPDRSALEGFDPLCPITGKAGDCIGAGADKTQNEEKQEVENVNGTGGEQDGGGSNSSDKAGLEKTADAANQDTDDLAEQVLTVGGYARMLLTSTKDVYSTLREMMASSKEMAMLVLMRFLLSACTMIMESTMLMFLQARFEITSKSNGFVLGFFGLSGVATNVFVARITRYFQGEAKTITWSLLAGGIGFFALALAPSYPSFMAASLIFTFGCYTARACLLTLFTQMVPPTRRGAYLGVGGSLESFCRVVMPLFGGLLLETSVQLPFLLAGVVQVVIAGVWYVQVVKRTNSTVGVKLQPLKKTK